jgi:hypothetical protein
MLPIFVSLSTRRLRRFFLLLLVLVCVCLPSFSQTHSIALGLGATQTIPFKRAGGNTIPPFRKVLTKPGFSGSVLYNYQPQNHIVGLETGLRIYRSAYALKQMLPDLRYSTRTTLRPDYLTVSIPIQAVFVFAKSPLGLSRFGQWAVVVGPHLSWINESGFGLRSQFQGSGRGRTKLTDTFGLNSYWRWGVGAGVRFQHPLSRNRFLSYRLDWASTFNGIQPWQASLEINGQTHSVKIPRQSLPVLTLQVAYGFDIGNKRIRGK